jgi:Family of unknown function (DUF6221)
MTGNLRTGMMTITGFLAARLDEKERIALAACGRNGQPVTGPEHWRWECAEEDTPLDTSQAIAANDEILHHGDHYRIILWSTEQYPALSGVGPLPHKIVDSQEVTPQVARFLAYRDPARALREVAAGRKILAEHAPQRGWASGKCQRCVTDREGYPEEWPDDDYPCQTVRALAEIDSDHPDYDPAWAPE